MGAEWTYLLTTRKVAGDDSAFSYVRLQYGSNPTDTVTGIVIYPDDFSFADAGVGAMPFGANYAVKQIDADEWEALENVGCVFLPGAYMMRYSTTNQLEILEAYFGHYAGYWSATTQSASKASRIDAAFLGAGSINPNNYNGVCERCLLFPVRLVQDL